MEDKEKYLTRLRAYDNETLLNQIIYKAQEVVDEFYYKDKEWGLALARDLMLERLKKYENFFIHDFGNF